MVDIVLRKRRARAGEIGLFPESDVFEEEWGLIKMDTDVDVQATQRGTERHLKFSHVIARWVADCNGEIFTDAQDARDALLIECRHVRRRFDKLRNKAELIPKSTRDLDLTAWARLIKLMAYHAVATFNVPPEKFEREGRALMADQRPEPPPYTNIPDGPGAPPADDPPGDPEPAANAAPAPASRDLDADGDEDAGEPEATVEAPQARQTALAQDAEKGGKPDAAQGTREPTIWTCDMDGDPDWRKDRPGDAGMYHAYFRATLENFTDKAAFINWMNCDDQWNLRQACKVGVTERKNLENYMKQKEWKS